MLDEHMRTFGIWIFGLLASGIAGYLAGAKFSSLYEHYEAQAMMAGMCAFACLRLWLAKPDSTP